MLLWRKMVLTQKFGKEVHRKFDPNARENIMTQGRDFFTNFGPIDYFFSTDQLYIILKEHRNRRAFDFLVIIGEIVF